MRFTQSLAVAAAIALATTAVAPAVSATSTTEPSSTQPATTQPATTQPATTQPPTTQPPTTTSTAPPTTSPPATTAAPTTTIPSVILAPSSPASFTVSASCYAGQELIDITVDAERNVPAVLIDLAYGQPDGSMVEIANHFMQGLLAGGSASRSLVVGPGSYRVTLEVVADIGNLNQTVYFPAVPPFDVQVPECPLPDTAPVVSATVEQCAADEDGALAVTMTNPAGGPEYDLAFVLEPVEHGFEENWVYESWPADGPVVGSPDDGGELTTVVDAISWGDSVKGLEAGDYDISLAWWIEVPGSPRVPTVVFRDAVRVTLAPCAPEFRVATFNVSMTGTAEGELVETLSGPGDPGAAAVAEIIQRTRPDVLFLNEFAYDAEGRAVDLFRNDYLAVAHGDAEPIDYPYTFVAPVNSGVDSGFDLDDDGTTGGPGDVLGRGEFPGQYGMVLLSRHPILTDDVRTFQTLPWAAMPDSRLPDDPTTAEPADWYTTDELAAVRLSSRSHWDVPIDIDGHIVHVLAAHPTPPVYDGDEDLNGLRNADEVRFWVDYTAAADTSWIVDDAGTAGGLPAGADFVIVGGLSGDPADGFAVHAATQQLFDITGVRDPRPTSVGAAEAAEMQGGVNADHQGDPATDTVDLDDAGPGNLRADYVLPSDGLEIVDAGVFWPPTSDPLSGLATVSNHHLVWVDVR